jgi:molecular chaperone HtpG
MADETLNFQTDVGKILHIVANSLYKEKQIFLRELISNASDACDRLRHLALTAPDLITDDPEFRVRIAIDKEARTIEIADNGIGMNREALVEDLGTIARSGSDAFLDQLTGDDAQDMALIGQFGVGFYSCFMVADRVEVQSRRAGEDQGWRWTSDGKGTFSIGEMEKPGRGTTIIVHLNEAEDEFLEPARVKHVVTTYSDHISLPIIVVDDGTEETVNQASALWSRPKSEIKDEQYTEFYRHVGHMYDEPWTTIHWRAEGRIEYTGLLFIPSSKPFDIFAPERQHHIRLYVKRVFITDDCDELMPPWLRFVRGLVDSEDLPLNVSRETLQNNPLVAHIRGAIVKRVLGELETKASKSPDDYAAFWENFGAVLKEGLYEDPDNREALLKLVRFRSTADDGLVSLDDYLGRMKDGQDAIYYISGSEVAALAKSPQLEGFKARGIEVLLLTDPVDDFWIPAQGPYEEKPFKSVTRAGADLGAIEPTDTDDDAAGGAAAPDAPAPGVDALITMFKLELGEAVKDVRLSERLTESVVCLVADEGDVDIHLERLLRQHRQIGENVARVLEINPSHSLIRALAATVGQDGAGQTVTEAAWLLLDQARILEGEPPPDPQAFSRRLAALMEKGLGS